MQKNMYVTAKGCLTEKNVFIGFVSVFEAGAYTILAALQISAKIGPPNLKVLEIWYVFYFQYL